jgi:hypothetical protein
MGVVVIPINSIQPVLENLIGVYNHKLNLMTDGITPYGGISSLDFGYIARFLILYLTLKFTYNLINSTINSMFKGGKK